VKAQAVVVSKKIGAVVDPFQLLQTVVDYGDKWVTEVQRGMTERAEIGAWEQVQTEKIRAQRDVLLKALDLTFDERRENFRRLFDGLDAAMEADDAGQASAFLESITELAKESPFKDLANVEIIAADLKRPDKTWDV
jgi:hypothetical protein